MISENLDPEIIIIGAGLTGLVLAHKLIKQNKKVLLIEKNNRVGGVIHTIQENDFVFESGPNTGVLSSPEVVELFNELNDVKTEIANKEAKKRWVLKNNKFIPLPSSLWSSITTPLFTWHDKFRILGEPWRKKGIEPHESLANLVRRRMGKSFLNYAIDPFISGIYAGNPETLIPKYALPKLYNLEQNYGSFIKGSIAKRKESKSLRDKKATKDVFSARGGLQNLIDALEKSIKKENILLNCCNTSISPIKDGFIISFTQNGVPLKIRTHKIVTTVPAPYLPSLIPFIPENNITPITKMEYARMIQVVLGYKKWTGIELKAFGGLIPKLENKKVLGILFPSAIFTKRAPEQGGLLSVFLGGIRHPEVIELSDEKLFKIAIDNVKSTLKEPNKPDLQRIFRYKYAIPQYTITTPEKLNAIAHIENQYKGLILAGSLRDGIGMADRIKQAFEISKTI